MDVPLAGSPARAEVSSSRTPDDFFVVGIGASAGGLESLEQLFTEVSEDTGMAYVVIQHLSPDFKSMMDELLARHTRVPIQAARDGMLVEPNHIYLLPPRKEMAIVGGRLLLTDKDPQRGLTLPIDIFFRSLARDLGERSVGVILSGTGSDGSRGILDIHEAGGLVLCEDAEQAKFDGMPRSAQETGVVDLVLGASEIARVLAEYRRSPSEARSDWGVGDPEKLKGVEAVFELLRLEHQIDFSHYKPTTVSRRIDRRLSLMHDDTLDAYVERLRSSPDELNALYQDLLIGVTQFFRDSEPFEYLETHAIPELIAKASEHEEIRVWVAACATGEEAYSLAILFREALSRMGRTNSVKIFATDVHRSSLEFAGHGLYDENRLAQISPERLKRHFIQRQDGYQVSQDLRQMVVFAQHNVIKDAPFTNLHLITCRNLLIYFQPQAQARALAMFHFGLRVSGVLLLGGSETPGELSDEFAVMDEHCKVFAKRRDVRLPAEMRVPLNRSPDALRVHMAVPRPHAALPDPPMLRLYDRLLDKHMPPSLLVNHQRQLVETFGGAEDLLRLKGRRQSHDLLDLLRTDAKTSIAGALNRVIKHGQALSFAGVRMDDGPGSGAYRLSIDPIEDPQTSETNYLITFEKIAVADEPPARVTVDEVNASEMTRVQVSHLEEELHYTKENLQATIEELETSNEEMQATNEELVASNEELQSTNEELHSVNEELYTVNAEYQKKIKELAELNQDMEHLLRSTDVAIVFLDQDLAIRKFTPQVAEVFDLVEQDVGRKISTFSHRIRYDSLTEDLCAVLEDGEPRETKVSDLDGRHYFLRVLPYRVGEIIDGVVLSLVDVSSLVTAEENVLREKERFQRVIAANRDGIWDWPDVNRDAMWWSSKCYQLLGYEEQEFSATHSKWLSLVHPDDRAMIEQTTVPSQEQCFVDLHQNFEYRMLHSSGEYRWFRHTAITDRDQLGRPLRMTGSVADIHQRKTEELQKSEEIRSRDEFLAMLSHELRNPLSAIRTATQILNGNQSEGPTTVNARQAIDRQASHMTRLLDDLLDVSRITQDKINLDKEMLDLRKTVEDAVQSVQSLCESCGVSIDMQLPDAPLWVQGDAARLQQVQANLLTNAVKYSPGGERVILEMSQFSDNAVIRVIDQGSGINPMVLDRIFDLFVQSDETLDRAAGGMGVGLTLVKKLVELHRGTVSAKSDGPGCGSVFEVRLPIAASTESPEEIVKPVASDGAAPKPRAGRVVLIEDQEDNRVMLGQLLELEGVEVYSAENGPAGLELIQKHRPDAAIIDIGLPKMDGYEVARRAREIGPAETVLIALTGYGQARDLERACEAGFDHHLVKPLQPERLREILGL
ncbi:MAG: chemotaxis protein CheB [Planctomycetota bacterium]